MNDQQYFLTASLSCQLKAAQRELSAFRSGKVYANLCADYERIIRSQNLTIKKLQKERDDFSFIIMSSYAAMEQQPCILRGKAKDTPRSKERLLRYLAKS